jgi:DNA topoisomerase-1
LVEREREIETFVPTPYWAIRVQLEVDGEVLQAEYERDRLATEAEAREVVHACAGKSGEVKKVEFNRSQISPPIPFDLPSLQDEAYRHFGLTPRFSLAIAEHLYLDQLISYPRTSSQKLPTSIGYERIVKHLGQLENYRLEANSLLRSGELKPVQGKRDDPAHPAVYPTGTRPKRHLENREQRVFDLVVRRFLATFGTSAVQGREKAVIKVGEHTYLLRGSRLIEKGWTALYTPYAKFEDNALPSLNVGQRVLVHDIRSEQKFTQPPSHYNPSSLLRKMEESEIGTKATRADIIETLYRRGYVAGQRMSATPLGSRIIEILTKYCPRVVDVNFTTELESKMEEIELGSRSREQVVLETIDYLKPIIEALKLRERELGEELNAIIVEMREESTTLSVPCPQCGSKLKIARNPRTGKRFIGCSGKWKSDCKFSLPLPQVGSLSLLHKLCPTCGFQLVQVKSRGRKPLVSCCKCYAAKPSGLSRIRPISSIQTNGSS